MNLEYIKVIAFDADDTLWVNETFYQDCEKEFCDLLKEFLPEKDVSAELLKTEINNLDLYGFGAKSFILSMIETALKITGNSLPGPIIQKIIILGKELIDRPIELLDTIEPVLITLKKTYKLILATKGDLLDQQRKLNKSGLYELFDHIEIMSDKKESDYSEMLKRLNIKPDEFLMAGNSLKSDIIPVLNIGGKAVYIPYHITWAHEKTGTEGHTKTYFEIARLTELLTLLPV